MGRFAAVCWVCYRGTRRGDGEMDQMDQMDGCKWIGDVLGV